MPPPGPRDLSSKRSRNKRCRGICEWRESQQEYIVGKILDKPQLEKVIAIQPSEVGQQCPEITTIAMDYCHVMSFMFYMSCHGIRYTQRPSCPVIMLINAEIT